MYNQKTILAIIPARSGSKGIADKNIKELNHKPLMAYTILACKKSNIFDNILVSTDSIKYAKIAEQYGASVPFLRPEELAADYTSTNDVIVHVLKELKQLGKTYDYIMLLQPTSPLRNKKHILESANILFEKHADSVVSICKSDAAPYLEVRLTETGELTMPFPDKQIRRQDYPQTYKLNGAIYFISTSHFLKNKSFYKGRTFPYVMSTFDSVDIDDDFQFKIAEILLQYPSLISF